MMRGINTTDNKGDYMIDWLINNTDYIISWVFIVGGVVTCVGAILFCVLVNVKLNK